MYAALCLGFGFGLCQKRFEYIASCTEIFPWNFAKTCSRSGFQTRSPRLPGFGRSLFNRKSSIARSYSSEGVHGYPAGKAENLSVRARFVHDSWLTFALTLPKALGTTGHVRARERVVAMDRSSKAVTGKISIFSGRPEAVEARPASSL